ncbi:MAG: Ig-like domain-containing protein [Cyclobacteriaceae bacterium]
MNKIKIILATILLSGCVGEDFIDDRVDERVEIANPISELKVGDTYQFNARFFNNVGKIDEATFEWQSSGPDIISVDGNGLATGLSEGNVIISVSVPEVAGLKYELPVMAGAETVVMENPNERSGTIQTTSSYTLEGDFTIVKTEEGLELQLASNYKASTALPGLYVYLTNNPATVNGAYEIGEVKVFSGANTMAIGGSVGIMDYAYLLYFCKPFNVKVGHGEIGN